MKSRTSGLCRDSSCVLVASIASMAPKMTLNELFTKLQLQSKKGPKGGNRPRRQKKKKQPKANARLGKLSLAGMSSASKYAAALLHPFSKQAEGARVPEPYAVASAVYKSHCSYVCTTNTSQAFDLILAPHPLLTAVSGIGSVSGGFQAQYSVIPTGVVARSTATAASLAASFKSYRVVAWGVRLKGITDFTKSGGRIYAAIGPASRQVPVMFSTNGTKSDWYGCFDAPYDSTTGGLPSTLLNFPRSQQFAVSQIMADGGIEITMPIVSPAAKSFNEASSEFQEQALIVGNPTTFAIAGGTSLGYGSTDGHSQLYLYGEGCGATGVATDVLSVDVVFHIEGIPNVSSASGGLVAASPYTPPPAGPTDEHKVHAAVAVAPIFRTVGEKAKEELLLFGQKTATDFFKKKAPQVAERMLGLLM